MIKSNDNDARAALPVTSRASVTVALLVAVLVTTATTASAQPRGGCVACDADCDGVVTMADAAAFADVLLSQTGCSLCAGDMNGDESLDGRDIQLFVDCLLMPEPVGACCEVGNVCIVTTIETCGGQWLGPNSSCEPGACITGTLTAYRPQHGTGYFPFARTPVAASDRRDDLRGPGIRINAPGDADPSGEDDLIEVIAVVSPAGASVSLRRSDLALRVWLTRHKAAGSEIAFIGDVTGALPLGPADTTLTLWVEWASPTHGTADLQLESAVNGAAADWIRFHTFRSIVLALGGENQTPSLPVDANAGTFVVGTALYQSGYDVHMHDEDDVSATGAGVVYDKAVEAVGFRGVDRIAIFGYSHGGGSTHDLASRLDLNRAGIGNFEIDFTSYVDGVGNSSDFDTSMETRRPPSTGVHANHYQRGTLADFFLDGGPVVNSIPPPTGLDVETTPWGAGATHFQVDDFIQVREFIEVNLMAELLP